MTQKIYHYPFSSLPTAFADDRGTAARDKKRSVERLADLLILSPANLYKRMEEGTMPANQLAAWFHATGGKAVIRHLAVQAGGLFIPLPTGRATAPLDVAALQSVLNQSIGALLAFMQGTATQQDAVAALTRGLEALALEREQVKKSDQPELDF